MRVDMWGHHCLVSLDRCCTQVHDSHNIHFATKVWKLAATDLNQVCFHITAGNAARMRTSGLTAGQQCLSDFPLVPIWSCCCITSHS